MLYHMLRQPACCECGPLSWFSGLHCIMLLLVLLLLLLLLRLLAAGPDGHPQRVQLARKGD
jgi:hypothetical protein